MIKKNSFLKFIVAMSVLIAMLASCSNGDGSKDASLETLSGIDAVSIGDKEVSENSAGEEISVSEENTESAQSEEVSDNVTASDNLNSEEESADSSQTVTDEIPEGCKVVRDDDGKTIIYGPCSVSGAVDMVVHEVGAIKTGSFFKFANYFLDSEEYEGAYYYVAIDPREAVEFSLTSEEKKAYFESFCIDCSDKTYYVYFTYVTEEQMIALAKEVATAERPIPYAYISLVHENAKEEYIQRVEEFS